MKTLLLIIASFSLLSCKTMTTTSPSGEITKITVTDTEFTTALASVAGVAAKEAAAAYIATHQPKSLVTPVVVATK